MAGSTPSLRDAVTQLAGLQRFAGGGQSIPKAEFRYYFKQYTPAHQWLLKLKSTQAGQAKAKKWSLLEPEIKQHWPTPPIDVEAQKEADRREWNNHRLDPDNLVLKLTDEQKTTKPQLDWADRHCKLGRNIHSTDKDRVSKTLETDLPPWLVDLLPCKDRYVDDLEALIKDVGSLSLRAILAAYEHESVFQSWKSLSLGPPDTKPVYLPPAQTWPQPQFTATPATPRPPATPQGAPTYTPRRQPYTPQVRFAPRALQPVASAPAVPPVPPQESCPLLQTPLTRQLPPHMPAAPPSTPQTPAGPVPSVLVRAVRADLPIPAAATLIPDTPERFAQHKASVEWWHSQHGSWFPTVERPYPLTPGRYEPTADLCSKCGLGDHKFVNCPMPEELGLPDQERTQPGTPTPQQRFRETNQVEFLEPEDDPNSNFKQGVRVGSESDDKDSLRTVIVDVGLMEDKAGEREWPFKMRVALLGRDEVNERGMWGTVDGGAMLLQDSQIVCQMANGTCAPSMGTGVAIVKYCESTWPIWFEVIDSRGAFELLLGKDWLRQAGAMQIFPTDSLSLVLPAGETHIENENPRKLLRVWKPKGPRTRTGQVQPNPDAIAPEQPKIINDQAPKVPATTTEPQQDPEVPQPHPN
ncbi:hypothetical protein FRC07_007905 [Ceratobasidium sp. 392]|nr:hypothetical protein FRC07_007905 [Ceratobasidium sp. 392]